MGYKKKCLHINTPKSNFTTDKIEYLGYTLAHGGIKPQEQAVSVMLVLYPPSNVEISWRKD